MAGDTKTKPSAELVREEGDLRSERRGASGLPHSRAGPSTSETERFLDEGEIARGGMGRVWQAFDRVLCRAVALKSIAPDLSGSQGDAVAKFIEEARVTGCLDHPNIVPVHDLSFHEGEPRLVMKLVEGETLTAIVERLHRTEVSLDAAEPILRMILRVCDAVAFAHSRGVIHRDIKPDNVMVGTYGQVYLMDWGVCRVTGAFEPKTHLSVENSALWRTCDQSADSISGTPAYMAPEQARGEPVDDRTDVFGLGGLLYFVLTGLGPNARATAYQTLCLAGSDEPREPENRLVWEYAPPALCAITKRALAACPENRYQSAMELKEAIEEFLRGGGWFATREFVPGAWILREGEPGDEAFIIEEGQCEAFRIAPDGTRITLRQMGPDDVFGEVAVLTGEVRSASVVAVTRVVVRVVTERTLRLELLRNRWLGAFVVALAGRFREKDAEVARLANQARRV